MRDYRNTPINTPINSDLTLALLILEPLRFQDKFIEYYNL